MKINRREFVKASALTAAATMLPAKASNLKVQDAKVRALLARMTLEEKVGQMMQAEQSGLKELSDIENYFLGSLLSGGTSDPKTGNGLKDWTDLYDSLQAHSQKTRAGHPRHFVHHVHRETGDT